MIESRELPAVPPGTNMREVGTATTRRYSTIEAIAMVCHEANRAWCIANGDTSQVMWSAAPEWQRTSAMNGVRAALAGKTPEELHESWCDEKRAAGWVWGPVKNPETKEHPCLVGYERLPAEQQRKDHLFRAVVTALSSPLASGGKD